jgi:Tol biopolymer transport system component
VTVGLLAATTEPVTERVSVDSAGVQGNAGSGGAAISADGRFVAFTSLASNLVVADTNFAFDVFVRDRLTGTTERVSVDSAGNQANGSSGAGTGNGAGIAVSADGCIVAFVSAASNLVAGDTNQVSDIFVRDRCTGTTERVNVGAGGQANGVFLFGSALGSGNSGVAMSADGRFVAFDSYATNLVPGDTNDDGDIFVRDRQAGTTERVNVDSAETESFDPVFLGAAVGPAISGDGRFVAFVSQAPNLVADDGNGLSDVFVRDRQSGTTERVSVAHSGVDANQSSGLLVTGANAVAISSDGRFVAFTSVASNLTTDDTNGVADVFVRDRLASTTDRVNINPTDGQTFSSFTPAISADGRFVAFGSFPSNPLSGDVTLVWIQDRETHLTELVSVNTAGVRALDGVSGAPVITADGRFVAFQSNASNLVDSDTNATFDVFVRDRGAFADTDPPTLSVPDGMTVDATSPAGALVVFAASATDNVDPDVPVTCTPASGSLFPVGTTTVTCTATDDAGNTASAAFDIVVRPFVVPFAAFLAEVEVEEPGQVEVKAMFRLGAMSDGIQPANETVTLRVGGLEVTIAAGSFVAEHKGRFRFKGAVNGINLDARIRPLAEGGFEFKAGLAREVLMPLGTRVEVSLTIGNDTGATTAAVDVE